MPYLVDTNVLLRSLQPSHPMHSAATTAIANLRARGEVLQVAAQNLMEFWRVATRPVAANGLGMTIAQAEVALQLLETAFQIAPDTADIYSHWRRLVVAHNVSGVQVHDARLVAVMKVHHLSHLLTFDTSDFNRYKTGEGITVIDPASVPAPSSPSAPPVS